MYKPNLLKISMQFFADADAATSDTSTSDTSSTTEQAGASTGGGDPEKSTQKADESKEQSKSSELSKEEKAELEEYRKWKESKKTDEEKQKDALTKTEKARLEAESKVSDYEAKFLAIKSGVSADNVDDVIALAKSKVTKDVTIEKAITGVLEKYPHFSKNDSTSTTGTGTQNSESESVDENKIRKIMGLPIKK